MSEAFYQKFLSFFFGFLILVFMVLIATELLFFYNTQGNILFYYGYVIVLTVTFLYGIRYYLSFRAFKETLDQGLYFPNSNNEKALNPICKPLNIEVQDLPLKACLHYRNGYSFKQITYKLRLDNNESETAKRLLIKGLDTLLKEHDEKEER